MKKATTKTMTKALRATLMDITSDGTKYVLDPARVTVTAKSESGVTRVLSRYHKDTITVSVDIQKFASMKNVFSDAKKGLEIMERHYANILHMGFDYKGDHYFWFMFSPSNARTADTVFVKANNWNEVESLLSEVTTLHYGSSADDEFSPERAFGKKNKDGKYEVLFSKVMARESARAAGSIVIKNLNAEDAAILSTFATKYVDDLTGINTVPFRNPITGDEGNTRETTPSDGMVLVGEKGRAVISHAYGIISDEERDAVLADPTSEKSEKVLKKCFAFIQPRIPGSLKGAGHGAKLHKYTNGAYEFVVFDSARKFKDVEWNWGDVEICNVSHRGSGYVSLNAPVVSGLIKANVDILDPIAKFWMDKVEHVFSPDLKEASKAVRYVMNALSANETEEDEDNRTVVVKALESNILLDRDHYVWSKIYDKMRAFATRMASGKMPVPGAYPYISVDTNYLVKALIEHSDLESNGVDIPVLKSGEYFFNGHICKALIARSPLTHPNQVKVVNLVQNDDYSDMRDVFIMNAYDGIWVDLAGADMDGDEVLLMMDSPIADFPCEAITKIIDAVSNEPVLNYEPGLSGDTVEYSFENRVKFLVKNAKRSKVGMLNNSYSAWVELYTHLRNLYLVAKDNGCNSIAFDATYSNPDIYTISNGTVYTKAIRDHVEGVLAFADVIAKMKDVWNKIAVLEILQSREVDAAKTNKGVTDKEAKEVSINAVSWSMIARQYSKNKLGDTTSSNRKVVEAAQQKAMTLASGEDSKTFGYRALTPLGYLTDVVSTWWNEMKAKSEVRGVSLSGYLFALMNENEQKEFHKVYDKIVEYKNLFGKRTMEIMQDEKLDDMAKRVARKELKERVIAALEMLAKNCNCSIEAVAVACYEACYLKNGGFNKGLSFAWMLPDALLRVFERGDMKYTYVLLDKQGTHGFVKNGAVYVGSKAGKYNLDMDYTQFKDQEFETYYSMKGKLAAFIRKQVGYAVNPSATVAPTVVGDVQNITFLNCDVTELKSKVKANGFYFFITINEEGKTVAKVNDEVVADVVLVNTRQIQLMNKRVKWVANQDVPFEEDTKNGRWIKNVTVQEA